MKRAGEGRWSGSGVQFAVRRDCLMLEQFEILRLTLDPDPRFDPAYCGKRRMKFRR